MSYEPEGYAAFSPYLAVNRLKKALNLLSIIFDALEQPRNKKMTLAFEALFRVYE